MVDEVSTRSPTLGRCIGEVRAALRSADDLGEHAAAAYLAQALDLLVERLSHHR